ncbi:hypothetical protein TcasGA2_TC008013 [Tribolium castaneum]|uniref:Uncharacterized protein n=1 Tax=Tribolium castaneum TaxID=7070 RepID=D1ZZB3_TRICA|nr:hypothetical protein TcasGA2_TC008013 [Tribolium castaneum]
MRRPRPGWERLDRVQEQTAVSCFKLLDFAQNECAVTYRDEIEDFPSPDEDEEMIGRRRMTTRVTRAPGDKGSHPGHEGETLLRYARIARFLILF